MKEFYYNKRILVTGHTGFKGTWLCMILKQLGAIIGGFSLPADSNNLFSLTAPDMDLHVEGDMNDMVKIRKTIETFQPEIIIHLASHSTLNLSHEITDYIFRTNVIGVVNLFEAIRNVNTVKSVVIVTSDKSYKNLETNEPYSEENPLGAQDPYSTSKACQELITECYQKSFFSGLEQEIGIATARASNVIGGGDFTATRLIPSLLNAYINGKTATIRNPQAMRPWQNVLDVLFGYLKLAKKLYEEGQSIYCSPFNFGPNEDGFVSVGEMAEKLSVEFDGAKYQIINPDRKVIETNILKLSNKKSKELLQWFPKFSFEETISMTAEFCKRQKKGETEKDICEDYIRRYFERSHLC